jgi:ribonuclease D
MQSVEFPPNHPREAPQQSLCLLFRKTSKMQNTDWVALDTEADSLHASPEKLCLIQISISRQDKLVDPTQVSVLTLAMSP